jgi:hypothetical protein
MEIVFFVIGVGVLMVLLRVSLGRGDISRRERGAPPPRPMVPVPPFPADPGADSTTQAHDGHHHDGHHHDGHHHHGHHHHGQADTQTAPADTSSVGGHGGFHGGGHGGGHGGH